MPAARLRLLGWGTMLPSATGLATVCKALGLVSRLIAAASARSLRQKSLSWFASQRNYSNGHFLNVCLSLTSVVQVQCRDRSGTPCCKLSIMSKTQQQALRQLEQEKEEDAADQKYRVLVTDLQSAMLSMPVTLLGELLKVASAGSI